MVDRHEQRRKEREHREQALLHEHARVRDQKCGMNARSGVLLTSMSSVAKSASTRVRDQKCGMNARSGVLLTSMSSVAKSASTRVRDQKCGMNARSVVLLTSMSSVAKSASTASRTYCTSTSTTGSMSTKSTYHASTL